VLVLVVVEEEDRDIQHQVRLAEPVDFMVVAAAEEDIKDQLQMRTMQAGQVDRA
jgi:hypothetical protein